MFRYDVNDLKNLTHKERVALSDDIADFLAAKTRFGVDTVIRNINVLETTIALHTVFDLRKDRLVFDSPTQIMVHKVLTGRSDELELRSNAPLMLDPSNPYDAYQGGSIGESIGNAIAFALETKNRVIVLIDDHALNYGITYENLIQINRFQPNLTIIMIDEQQSLLRHVSAFDSLVKSVRISKTYTGTKESMKSILDSNPVSRPLYNSLVKMRNALKETVLEPTIFTQLGINYQGPIDGQNIQELIRVFELSKKLEGPHVIHVQTRLRLNRNRRLEFPNFKTDQDVPKDYRTYHEIFDEVLVNKRNPKIMMLVDAMNLGDYFDAFESSYPNNYKTVSGATESLISMAAGYARMGYRVVVSLDASKILENIGVIQHQFVDAHLPLILLVRGSGLSAHGPSMSHGIYDTHALTQIGDVFIPKDLFEASIMLDSFVDMTGVQIIRYQNKPEAFKSYQHRLGKWIELCPITPLTQGVIITTGHASEEFASRINQSGLNVSLVHCPQINLVDELTLNKIYELNKKVLIYDVEDIHASIYSIVTQTLFKTGRLLSIENYNLQNSNLNLGSKIIKRESSLMIDDALRYILER